MLKVHVNRNSSRTDLNAHVTFSKLAGNHYKIPPMLKDLNDWLPGWRKNSVKNNFALQS